MPLLALLLTIGCAWLLDDRPPFEPTPPAVVRAMLEMANVGPDDVVYDLGSGDGRIPIAAARDFGARAVGIEIDPALVTRARQQAAQAGLTGRVEFRQGDMYAADLTGATVVTLFLNPRPNLKLRPKLQSSLPPGARIVSYVWGMGDWQPDAVRMADRRSILLWRIPGGSESRPPHPVHRPADIPFDSTMPPYDPSSRRTASPRSTGSSRHR